MHPGHARDEPDAAHPGRDHRLRKGHLGKPDWWWEWLGENVLRPVIDARYAINLDRVAPLTGFDRYGPGGTRRMTRAEWRHFDGLCARSNVPVNAHWDIGDGRLDLVAAAAGTLSAPQ